MITPHQSIQRAACLALGLGIVSSAFGQTLKTENFNVDPGWIGVNNTQFDELIDTDPARESDTPSVPPGTPRNGYTNFGFQAGSDTTGNSVLPPDFDGAGPFVPTASGAGEAGGGFGNNPGTGVPGGLKGRGSGYYADNVGSLNMNMSLMFSGVLTFTENRDRVRIGFFQSFDSPTNNPYTANAGNQPGPDPAGVGSHRRPEFLGIEGDASSGIRLTPELGRSRNSTNAMGVNNSTGNTLADGGVAFVASRNGVTPPNIIPVPFTFKYDPNAGPEGAAFGAISITIPGATFNPVGTHVAQIQDPDGDGVDNEDADGNDDFPGDAEVFTLNLTQSQREAANSFVFDRFGMVTGPRQPDIFDDPAATDNGQDAFLDDVTYSINLGGGLAGDFNGDAVVNATDIDLLCDRINAGTGPVAPFDVNGDGSVNQADVNFEVTNILETKFGDTDTDGDVDLNDLGNLATGFNVPGEKRWSRGNFDCDLDVDLPDLGTLATNFDAGRAAALAAFEALVPEPSALSLLALGALGLQRRSRRS